MKELDLLEQYLSASPEQRRTIASPGGISFLNAGIVSPQNQAAAVMPSAEGQRMPIMKDAAKGVPSYLMKNEDYAKQAKIPNSISRTYTPTAEDNLNAALISGLPGEAKFKAERQDVGPVEIARPEPEFSRPIDKKNFISKKPMPKAAQSIAAASIPVAPPAPEPVAEVIQPPTPEPIFELPPATEPETSIVDKYNEGMGRAALKSDIDRMTNDAMIDKLSQPSTLRNSLNDKVLEFALNSKKFEPSRDYNADIDRLNKESQALKGTNDGDMWSHLIYSLGAPLLGALTGSAGALAAPKAQADIDKESQMHWKARAQMRSKLEDSISKRMNAIKGLRSEEFDNNFKEQDALLKKYQLLNEVVKGADLTQKDQFDKYMTLKNNLDMEAAKAGFAAPKTAAEIEQKSIDEQGRNAREIDKIDANKWRDQQKALEDTKKLKAQQEYDAKKRKEYQEWMSAEKEKDRKSSEKKNKESTNKPGRFSSTEEAFKLREHNKIIAKVMGDKSIIKMKDAASNLARAKSFLDDPYIVKDYANLEEVQKLLQQSVGLRNSALADRKDTNFIKGLEAEVSKVKQYLTSKPTAVNAPEIVKQLKALIRNEKFSTNSIFKEMFKPYEAGYGAFYNKYPDMKEYFVGTVKAQEDLGDIEVPKIPSDYRPLTPSGGPTKPAKEMTREEKIKAMGGK